MPIAATFPHVDSTRKEQPLRVCVDRVLPEDRKLPFNDRLAVRTMKRWKTGSTLDVQFLDGDPGLRQRVADIAVQWTEHANLAFRFGHAVAKPAIRISFRPGASWSLVGIDAKAVPPTQPTMNFGWYPPETSDEDFQRVVLHEFGHALGCIHEHQREGAVPWNRAAVRAYYTGPPHNWSPEDVETNIFTTYDEKITQRSEFDPTSIMIYPIPGELTDGKLVVDWNMTLSPTDIDFIGRVYPRVPPSLRRLEPGADPLDGQIDAQRPCEDFRFDLAEEREVVIETTGYTDLALLVLGPDSAETIAARDPGGGGAGGNVKVQETLEEGTYLARISHRRPGESGDYAISLR